MADAAVAIGSNQGRSLEHMRAAAAALRGLPRTSGARFSAVYRTSPVGGPRGQRDYINAAAVLRTSLSPEGLLAELKRIETARGRRPGPRWGPRPLDLDLLFYGRMRLRSRILRLPHPRALERRFVLTPLAELAPRFVPPARPRRTVRDWLESLNAPSEKVEFLIRTL